MSILAVPELQFDVDVAGIPLTSIANLRGYISDALKDRIFAKMLLPKYVRCEMFSEPEPEVVAEKAVSDAMAQWADAGPASQLLGPRTQAKPGRHRSPPSESPLPPIPPDHPQNMLTPQEAHQQHPRHYHHQQHQQQRSPTRQTAGIQHTRERSGSSVASASASSDSSMPISSSSMISVRGSPAPTSDISVISPSRAQVKTQQPTSEAPVFALRGAPSVSSGSRSPDLSRPKSLADLDLTMQQQQQHQQQEQQSTSAGPSSSADELELQSSGHSSAEESSIRRPYSPAADMSPCACQNEVYLSTTTSKPRLFIPPSQQQAAAAAVPATSTSSGTNQVTSKSPTSSAASGKSAWPVPVMLHRRTTS